MKRLSFLLFSCLSALLSFTSCDPDDIKGMALSGEWEGDFSMYYQWVDRYDRLHESRAYCTYLEFTPYANSYSSGYGYQTDFYDDGPYCEIYHSFRWEVRNEVIYLDYCHREDEDLSTFIRDYSMSNYIFDGYFGNSNVRFRLDKRHDYYDWTPYINDFGDYRDYDRHRGWGYYDNSKWWAATRAEGTDDDSCQVRIVHYGNLYIDGVETAK